MVRFIIQWFSSLKLTVWILTVLIAVFFLGAYLMPRYPEAHAGINAMPLFAWWSELGRGHLEINGWLPLSVLLLAVLTLNTVVCTIRSLRPGPSLWAHVTHLGFLLILVAHLVSAATGFKEAGIVLVRGRAVEVPRLGAALKLNRIDYTPYPNGMPRDYSAEVTFVTPEGSFQKRLGPNRPAFYRGVPVYLKDFRFRPVPYAVCEVAHDPGAWVALAGSIVFLLGALPLPFLTGKKRSSGD
jgi:hypothetical protein